MKLEALSTSHLLDMVRCQPYQSIHVQLTEFLGISAYTPSFVWVVNVNWTATVIEGVETLSSQNGCSCAAVSIFNSASSHLFSLHIRCHLSQTTPCLQVKLQAAASNVDAALTQLNCDRFHGLSLRRTPSGRSSSTLNTPC